MYPLSLHDALPICLVPVTEPAPDERVVTALRDDDTVDADDDGSAEPPGDVVAVRYSAVEVLRHKDLGACTDRKSTRLNSSHMSMSYAVFCLKKKMTRATTAGRMRTRVREPEATGAGSVSPGRAAT